MKRILFFLLLLVNLHLTTDNGSLSIGLGEVVAQRVQEERLSKVTTRGWGEQWQCPYCRNIFYDYSDKNIQDHLYYECDALTTTCPQCHDPVKIDDLAYHMGNTCRFRKVQCPTCYEVCYAYEIEWGSHVCTSHCMCCGSPLGYGESCVCGCDLEAIGEEPWWMKGGYPAGGSDGGYDDGGGIGGGVGQNSEGTDDRHISIRDLKLKKGVRLVSYTKIPDKLHPQILKNECVVRAYAFMAQLKGYDYETAYNALAGLAKAKGYDLEDFGIPTSALQKAFKSYCIIEVGDNTPKNVAQFIDRGESVALITSAVPPHMVTVIGYDNNYYYAASGDKNGQVTIYQKNELLGNDNLYVVNKVNTPYK